MSGLRASKIDTGPGWGVSSEYIQTFPPFVSGCVLENHFHFNQSGGDADQEKA